MPQYKDKDGNQIKGHEKVLSAILLIAATCTSIFYIIGLWPDRIPPTNEGYQNYCEIKLFEVKVISLPQSTIDQVLQYNLVQQTANIPAKKTVNKPNKPKVEVKGKSKAEDEAVEAAKKIEEQKAAVLKKQEEELKLKQAQEQLKLKQAQQQQITLIDSITANIIVKSLQLCCNTQATNPLALSLL